MAKTRTRRDNPFIQADMDTYGRTIDYLRISVTDRCNERCLYCMPEGYKGWEQKPDHLTANELVRVVKVAASMGFRKFRLTGGEPTVRRDLLEIVSGMAEVSGVECIGISTNGTRLEQMAGALRKAGVRTVNISLDALSAPVYHRITGGQVTAVLNGICAAIAAGFECMKLNCVLMRGINEQEIWPLVLFAGEHGLPLRLIELMPVTTTAVLSPATFFPITEAMQLLAEKDELVPQPDTRIGWGPAKYYKLQTTGALVGFIGALTDTHFCESCNKMRLTADGRIRPCLGDHGEVILREALRATLADEHIKGIIQSAIQRKPLEHSFRNGFSPCRPMPAIGG